MDTQDRLTEEEIFSAITEILCGERVSIIPNYNTPVIFTFPTGKNKVYLTFYEKQRLNFYLSEGLPSEERLPSELLDSIFSVEDQEALEDLESKIKGYELLLRKRSKGTEQYAKDFAKINELRRSKSLLGARKASVGQFTADYKAREDKYILLMSQQVLKLDRQPLWDNSDSAQCFFNAIDDFYTCLNEYLLFYFGYSTLQIRQIARSSQWRNYYISSTRGLTTLFDRKAEDLSLDQLHLLTWSHFYADVREMSIENRPTDELMEDDESLDKYLREYTAKVYAELELRKKDNLVGQTIEEDHTIITAESDSYVPLHKKGAYSDTEAITSRVSNDAVKYSENEEYTQMRRKQALKALETNE